MQNLISDICSVGDTHTIRSSPYFEVKVGSLNPEYTKSLGLLCSSFIKTDTQLVLEFYETAAITAAHALKELLPLKSLVIEIAFFENNGVVTETLVLPVRLIAAAPLDISTGVRSGNASAVSVDEVLPLRVSAIFEILKRSN